MRRLVLPCLLPAMLLAACHGDKQAGGGNVTLRDMEVVDGTANDAMVDLDNAADMDGGVPAIDNAAASPTTTGAAPTTATMTNTAATNMAAPARPRSAARPSARRTPPRAGEDEVIAPD